MKPFFRTSAGFAICVLWGLGIAVGSVAIAQENQSTPSASSAPQPSVTGSAVGPRATGYAPDPPAIRSAAQWQLTFQYRHGKVTLLDARRVQLKTPISTPRRMGRFAAELLRGPTIVERVRFDFPLIGADELAGQQRPRNAPPSFEGKATVVYRIMLPDTPRASRARLVDRATGESIVIPWPPGNAPSTAASTAPSNPSADAGIDCARGESGGPCLDAEASGSSTPSDAAMPQAPEQHAVDGGAPVK